MAKGKKRETTNEAEAIRLYKAVARYVAHRGGAVVMSTGIQIQQWPGKGKFCFSVAVECTGRKPEFASAPIDTRTTTSSAERPEPGGKP